MSRWRAYFESDSESREGDSPATWTYAKRAYWIVDTLAELPTSYALHGDRAFCVEDSSSWVRNEAGDWEELAGGSGEHPTLAAHDSLGLATQTELDDGLGTKAASGHNHDAAYEATGAVATHAAAADPHSGYLTPAEHTSGLSGHHTAFVQADHDALPNPHHSNANDHANTAGAHSWHSAHASWITASGVTYENLDANGDVGTSAGTLAIGSHTHPGGSEAFPVGSVFIAVVSTDPATLLGYGTWSAFGAGRVLVGRDGGDTDFDVAEETGGAKTKAISAHAGAAVANHAFTQPSAHSAHAVTQPSAHSDHTGVITHVHRQQYNPTTTGALSGPTTAPDTSSSGTTGWGTVDTQAPSGAVASLAHSAHTGTAVDAHSAHAGGAVDAHAVTQPSAHSDLNVVQPYIVVYMWKRTA